MSRLPPWVLAAALGAAYLVANPRTADLAAQTFRADLWARHGFLVWDNLWYAGHHVPAYSLLFPPLAAWLGPQLVGVLSAVAGTWAFGRLAGREHRLAGCWAALAMGTLLVTGRLTFALGVALGLAALAAAREAWAPDRPRSPDTGQAEPPDRLRNTGRTEPPDRRRAWGAGRRLGQRRPQAVPAVRRPPPDVLLRATLRGRAAIGLAALCSAASPVAGAFLALAVAAWWLGDRAVRGPRLVVLAAAALAPALVAALLFPEGGTFPFVLSSFVPALAGTLLVWAVLPTGQSVLRAGTALTAVVLVASWALPTPMGGNAVRVAALFAGPVLALALLPAGRGRTLALLAPALLYWQLAAPVDDWRQTAGDPSVRERSYGGLVRFLTVQDGPPSRVTVPFTDNHWEAAHLGGAGVALARGWERQYDRKVNALFYDDTPLSPVRYRRWLDANAVRFVVLARAPIDYSGAAEAQLIRDGLPYLRRVYADAVFTAYEVRGWRPIGVTRLTVDGFTTDGPGAVRVRWSPYFEVVAGRGCVRRSADGFTAVDAAVRVRARASLAGALRRDASCR